MNTVTACENKDYAKFLGVLIDKHLTWKQHIDYIASKISKIVGLIVRLRHRVPLNTLLQVLLITHISLYLLQHSCLGPSCSV